MNRLIQRTNISFVAEIGFNERKSEGVSGENLNHRFFFHSIPPIDSPLDSNIDDTL